MNRRAALRLLGGGSLAVLAVCQAPAAVWNRAMREVVEPGPVIVSVGNSSASLKQAEFTVA